jgi:hypothetical protein
VIGERDGVLVHVAIALVPEAQRHPAGGEIGGDVEEEQRRHGPSEARPRIHGRLERGQVEALRQHFGADLRDEGVDAGLEIRGEDGAFRSAVRR